MNEQTPRLSLRSLFLAMTLVATVVAMGFNFPVITFFVLLLLSPFMFVAVMASLTNRAPGYSGLIAVLAVGAVILFVAFFVLIAMAPRG